MESSQSNPSAPILRVMTLEDIIRARLEKPYNLPTDLETAPKFGSFEERYEFIQRSLLKLSFRELNRQLREQANESDTSTDESEDEGGRVAVDWEAERKIAQSVIDTETEGNESEGRNERLDLVHSLQFRQLGISGGLRRGIHGGYRRGSGGGARGDARLAEGLRRSFAGMTGRTSQPHRSLEPGEIPDGVKDVHVDIEGANAVGHELEQNSEFRVVNLVQPPALSPPSTPTRKRRDPEESSQGPSKSNSRDRSVTHESPWGCPHRAGSHPHDDRDTASSSRETRDTPVPRTGDYDSPESSVGERGITANAGSLPENSIEPTSARAEGMVWPKFKRRTADDNLRTGEKETTSGKKPKATPCSWADVYAKLPAVSGGEVQSPEEYRDKRIEFQRIKREEFKQTILGSSHPNRRMRVDRFSRAVRDRLNSLEVTFVGENCHMQKFSPWRGDLIIALRNGRPQPSYLKSYTEELGHNFSNGELVLRIGYFKKFPIILSPNDFEYKPYAKVELYAFNQMDTRPPTKWKFLGNQNELDGALFHPPYESPGKFLKVGTPVLDSNTEFEPIVPRRGDVIIKREAWKVNFHHNVNFWYSMVKWHRGTKFHFAAGDMLVRRFIDNLYNEQKSLNMPRNPFLWGWAELYEYHDFHNWIFWGRTKHCYDVPLATNDTILINYTCDDGEDSEEDMDFEIINPRHDAY